MRLVVIDEEACTGHGRCYALAPSIFDCDDFGHGVVTAAELTADLDADAQKAIANCPEHAITIVEN